MLPVEVLEELHDLARAEDLEQALAAVDERHLEPELAQGRGHLHPDEAGADDDGMPCVLRRVVDPRRVVERPERVDPLELGTRDAERPWRRARGDQELVEPLLTASVDAKPAVVKVELGDARLEVQVDVVVPVELLRLDERLLRGDLAAEEPLGERRAVVGDVCVLREERDRAVPAGLAVALDRPAGRQTTADDHQPVATLHVSHRIRSDPWLSTKYRVSWRRCTTKPYESAAATTGSGSAPAS